MEDRPETEKSMRFIWQSRQGEVQGRIIRVGRDKAGQQEVARCNGRRAVMCGYGSRVQESKKVSKDHVVQCTASCADLCWKGGAVVLAHREVVGGVNVLCELPQPHELTKTKLRALGALGCRAQSAGMA